VSGHATSSKNRSLIHVLSRQTATTLTRGNVLKLRKPETLVAGTDRTPSSVDDGGR
jgi:hypothetical protein